MFERITALSIKSLLQIMSKANKGETFRCVQKRKLLVFVPFPRGPFLSKTIKRVEFISSEREYSSKQITFLRTFPFSVSYYINYACNYLYFESSPILKDIYEKLFFEKFYSSSPFEIFIQV